mgnify:CR=1 FL=1
MIRKFVLIVYFFGGGGDGGWGERGFVRVWFNYYFFNRTIDLKVFNCLLFVFLNMCGKMADLSFRIMQNECIMWGGSGGERGGKRRDFAYNVSLLECVLVCFVQIKKNISCEIVRIRKRDRDVVLVFIKIFMINWYQKRKIFNTWSGLGW